MASKNPGRKEMKGLIDQFCSISGADKDVAKRLLEACAWNLEMAIGMHMDGGEASNQPAPSGSQAPLDPEENVRAPIPQRQEVLVDPSAYPTTIRRRTARSVFDGFRDFQAEARQQERLSSNGGASSSAGSSKLRTLEDLFRPPIDIMHKGSFHSARDVGSNRNRWLIVNIQNSKEFNCQILNRDVWSHRTVKDIIQQHFIFWQVYHDSEEGRKYMQFYKISDWPYIAVLDPRTGENIVVWSKVDQVTFCDLVTAFLADKPCPDGSSPSAAKPEEKDKTLIDASEDSQLELAIKASLQESLKQKEPDDSALSDSEAETDDLETFSDSGSDTLTGPPSKKSTLPSTSKSLESQSKGQKRKADQLEQKNSTVRDVAKFKSLRTCSNGRSSPLSFSNDNSNDSFKSNSSTNSKTSKHSFQNSSKDEDLAKDNDTVKDNDTATDNDTSEAPSDTGASKETNSEFLNWQHYTGEDSDPKSKLVLRFPDGNKEQFTLPSTSKLRALVLYVVEKGYSNESYELVTNYPRRNISDLDADKTLKDHGLFPQEAIFIQSR